MDRIGQGKEQPRCANQKHGGACVVMMKKETKYKWLAVPIVITTVAFLLLRFVFLIGYVPTASMEPTLHQGSYILGIRCYGELKAGDIVVFEHEGKLLVKRIATVGGDKVMHTGQEWTVPNGCYYMLGDNAANSFDSRYWSEPFIPQTCIVAKLISCTK